MSGGTNTICMYTPTADGGHARYAWELMTALAAHPERSRDPLRFELVSREDVEPQFRAGLYPAHPTLPRWKDRAAFRTRSGWVANRLTHYTRRELQFLRWLEGRPDEAGVHFQEWTPWLAAPLFRRIRAM